MRFALALTCSALLLISSFVSCKQQSDSKKASINQSISLPDFSTVSTENVFVYNCGDSLSFTAHVTKDSTWLFLEDTTVKILSVRSGSGARYESNAFIYWSKGNKAILQKPKGSFMTCQSIPQERSWATAKLRGVDFRALGQEPGWHLEISEGKQITYIGNYGQDTVIVPTKKPEISQQGKHTIYRSKTGQHTLKIEITDTACIDVMSGFSFPYAVTITVDGNTFSGCGRAL